MELEKKEKIEVIKMVLNSFKEGSGDFICIETAYMLSHYFATKKPIKNNIIKVRWPELHDAIMKEGKKLNGEYKEGDPWKMEGYIESIEYKINWLKNVLRNLEEDK